MIQRHLLQQLQTLQGKNNEVHYVMEQGNLVYLGEEHCHKAFAQSEVLSTQQHSTMMRTKIQKKTKKETNNRKNKRKGYFSVNICHCPNYKTVKGDCENLLNRMTWESGKSPTATTAILLKWYHFW